MIPSKVLKELVANKENAQVLSRNDASDLVGAIREIPGLGWYVGVFKKEEDRESAIISMAATNSPDLLLPFASNVYFGFLLCSSLDRVC